MNLIGAIGGRTVYTWAEVCEWAGMRLPQLKGHVYKNRLVKRFSGQYPFAQKDVNEFMVRLCNGQFESRRGRRRQVQVS